MFDIHLLRQKLVDSTPGPWVRRQTLVYAQPDHFAAIFRTHPFRILDACRLRHARPDLARLPADAEANADLIVEAVNALPSLLDRLEAHQAEIAAMEQRALAAESLLSSIMKGGDLMAQALGEAGETFGFLHACMFGAEAHLREHGWLKPELCTCQAPPTHMANDCPIHGLDDGKPF